MLFPAALRIDFKAGIVLAEEKARAGRKKTRARRGPKMKRGKAQAAAPAPA
ncbi:MAG: hypothetical protein MO847_04475 [Candidatus Protistobacter heckmanni]|nr:hypothetical protein [Candidatus Protistobacter heckmanni]